MTEISIEPFTQGHLDGLIALVGADGWTEYTDDVERTHRALTAPGVTTLVAIAGGHLVGAIQVQSDGVIQAHVSMLLIDRNSRGTGLGSRLLRQGLERAGGVQLDIRTRTEGYYERLGASRSLGFRLTRENLGLDGTDAKLMASPEMQVGSRGLPLCAAQEHVDRARFAIPSDEQQERRLAVNKRLHRQTAQENSPGRSNPHTRFRAATRILPRSRERPALRGKESPCRSLADSSS
jgi:ribosomal protein S18 acetylase RimI-like enzyme